MIEYDCNVISVSPRPDTTTIFGLPDYALEESSLSLTCAVNPIRPLARAMYWTIGGQVVDGSPVNTTHGNGTFAQELRLSHRQNHVFVSPYSSLTMHG